MFLLHAAGGSDIGVGHLSRCRSLALELLRQGIGPVELLFEASADLAARFALEGANLSVAASRVEALRARGHLLSAHDASVPVLITDLLRLGAEDGLAARRQGFQFLAHLNDSATPNYGADVVIDGDAFKAAAPTGQDPTRYLCGAAYHIVAPAVVARRPTKPWQGAGVRAVLICFGGADPAKQTELFVREVRGRPSPFKFTVVAGPGFSTERFEALRVLAGPDIILARAPAGLAELILAHDAVVTMGGLTSYEAMCLGRAVFAVAWFHLAHYVERLEAAGLLQNLGLGEPAVARLYESLTHTPEVRRLAEAGWQAIDGKGVERAVTCIRERVEAKRVPGG